MKTVLLRAAYHVFSKTLLLEPHLCEPLLSHPTLSPPHLTSNSPYILLPLTSLQTAPIYCCLSPHFKQPLYTAASHLTSNSPYILLPLTSLQTAPIYCCLSPHFKQPLYTAASHLTSNSLYILLPLTSLQTAPIYCCLSPGFNPPGGKPACRVLDYQVTCKLYKAALLFTCLLIRSGTA